MLIVRLVVVGVTDPSFLVNIWSLLEMNRGTNQLSKSISGSTASNNTVTLSKSIVDLIGEKGR